MPSQPTMAHVELRFSANNLANKDLFSLSDPFLVCHTVRNGAPAERIGRTETVKDNLNPVWTTTISLAYSPHESTSPTILIDIFDRDSPDNSSLTKHDFLGRAAFRLYDLLQSPYARLDMSLVPARDLLLPSSTSMSVVSECNNGEEEPLTRDLSVLTIYDKRHSIPRNRDLSRAISSSRAAKKVRGTLSVFAEKLRPCAQHKKVMFAVSSAMLRDASTFGRRVTQFYEIQRERLEGPATTWSCVFRSPDGLSVDKNNYVQFDQIAIPEQQLHNMIESRRLRIAFFKRHTRQQHELISYITFSIDQLLSIVTDRTEAAIKMEGQYGDEDGLGNVIVQRVERWVNSNVKDESEAPCQTFVQLRADHFLHSKFVSSLNDGPKHGRRLRQLPAFITLH